MNRLKLLIVFVGFFAIKGSAQLTTNSELLVRSGHGFRLVENANHAKALSLAKQKGWQLTIKTSSGKMGTLVGVDDLGFPKYYISQNNTIAAATTRANQLWPGGTSGLNLSGSTAALKNKMGIWDESRPLATHVELVGRITQKDSPSSTDDHPTHVAGTMIATGLNPIAKGMAFGMQGIVAYDFNNDISEMFGEASNLLLSNHSYGIISGWNYNAGSSRWEFYGKAGDNEDYKFGYYSSDAQLLDSIAYNAPNYLIVKAAGNNRGETGPAVGSPYYRYDNNQNMVSAGNRPATLSSNDSYNTIPWDGNAKNILTVGAISGIPGGYTGTSDAVIGYFSDFGPTDDGRIKPDIVADGIDVISSIATNNTSYGSSSGTSMSTPNATGSLLLLQELYTKLKPGLFLRSATVKGLAIHTADEAGPSDGPDYQYGWGVLNVDRAATVINSAVKSNNADTSNHLLFENNLANGGSTTYNVIASGRGQLVATICWTDPKGDVETVNVLNNSTKKLVNDLDIRITKGSRTYFPWVLDPTNPGAPATKGDNILDNVEKVSLDSVVPGQTYTIKISHKGSLARGSQAYSLLVSGVGGVATCASNATSSAGARIDSVSFKSLHYANPAGCTTYTDNTNITTNIESSQTIPFYVKTGTCDASSNARVVTAYIDYNNNGQFEPTEKVAQSAVLTTSNAVFSGSIVTASNLPVGNLYLMRIIVQETSTASAVVGCGTYGNGETSDFRLRVTNPTNDLSIDQLISPSSGSCGIDSQYVTISIKNNGPIDQSNVPVSLLVQKGSTTILNISTTYPLTIPALSSVSYTFTRPFASSAATTFTITSAVNLSTDQYTANNTNISTISTASKPTAPTATGIVCSGTAVLKVNSPSLASNYFWYTAANSTTPFATGTTASTSNVPPNNTFYVGKETRGTIGLNNKMLFASGGYNSFSGNFININNSVPLTIETARLYIANAGTITFLVANFNGWTDATHSSYNYSVLNSVTINVYPTTPTPTPANADGSTSSINNPADTGAVYNLNLQIPTSGDHIIVIDCKNGASIFRNGGITTAPYPIGIPNLFTITGNSAATVALPNQYQNYYYWFYDMRFNTGDCASDLTAVVATTVPTPVITQVADSLTSSIANGNQWWFNDTLALTGATLNHFKPTKSGSYKTVVADPSGCFKTSNSINVVVTALNDILVNEIKLTTSPNPSKGLVNISFEMNVKKDLTLEIFNLLGKKVYQEEYPGFIGNYNKTLNLSAYGSDMYVLKIRHNSKTYTKKILIER
jgi:hypothetical protein